MTPVSKMIPRPRPGDHAPYYRTYVDLVPEQTGDILRHLKKQGVATMNFLKGLDENQAQHRYAPEKWSVKEVLGHLIDTERLFAFRALWIARGQPEPQPGMDEKLWARNSDADRRTLVSLWRELHVCRTDHLYLFKSLDTEGLQRCGVCNDNPMTAGAIPWIIAGHERHHLNVLRDRYGLMVP